MFYPEITIEQGTLRGSISKNIRGDPFFQFQGIPYAKPPLGNLRFKAPQPPEKWSGIYDATKERNVCPHRDLLKNWELVEGSEDCLFLNVFTKNLPSEKNLRPVLFWIHGGGLVFGSGSEELYGPGFLMTEDVVLVTINYRLGLLGLVNFEDPSLDIPGNASLKDQIMALKWVKKNIEAFGGDSNNVTIFGESAGGASVHLLTLSPMAKGLFHKAISQSGCAVAPWIKGHKGAKWLGEVMGLEGADDKTIYKALMGKNTDEVLEIQHKMIDNIVPAQLRPFGLVVETNSKEAFLDEEPLKLMSSGKFTQVPFMIGYTSSEGMCFEIFRQLDQPDVIDFEQNIPWYLGYEYGSEESKALGEKIKKFYFGNEEYSQKNRTKKFDMLSDIQFWYATHVVLNSQYPVSSKPIYFYKMTVETELNFFKKMANVEDPGVSHCDDVGYLFTHCWTPKIQPGSIEDISLSKVVKLWTNFAKYGNPTPDVNDKLLKVVWKAVTDENLDYLEIGRDLVAKKNPDFERISFWKGVFEASKWEKN